MEARAEMRCVRCERAALYQEPGFNGVERTYCTTRGEWRERCRHGKRGKPRRAVLDVYVTIDGAAAVEGRYD